MQHSTVWLRGAYSTPVMGDSPETKTIRFDSGAFLQLTHSVVSPSRYARRAYVSLMLLSFLMSPLSFDNG